VYRGQALAGSTEDPTSPPEFRTVAVKVIHPNIKEQIEIDLDLMRNAGELLSLLPSLDQDVVYFHGG